MINIIEANKITSYNLKATYLTYDIYMAISIDELNNAITTPLNGNVNVSGSYIGFGFDNNFVLQNESELTPIINPDLLAFIKQLGLDTKTKYNF